MQTKQMKEELYMQFCMLNVPAGAQLKSQMTVAEVMQTKKVANLRIHGGELLVRFWY